MLAFYNKPINLFDVMFDSLSLDHSYKTSLEEGKYCIHLDVPGLKCEDIKIEFKNGVLSIKGSRELKSGKKSYFNEFVIPRKFDIDTLTAELEDGVLTVKLSPFPKKEVAPATKKFEVKLK